MRLLKRSEIRMNGCCGLSLRQVSLVFGIINIVLNFAMISSSLLAIIMRDSWRNEFTKREFSIIVALLVAFAILNVSLSVMCAFFIRGVLTRKLGYMFPWMNTQFTFLIFIFPIMSGLVTFIFMFGSIDKLIYVPYAYVLISGICIYSYLLQYNFYRGTVEMNFLEGYDVTSFI